MEKVYVLSQGNCSIPHRFGASNYDRRQIVEIYDSEEKVVEHTDHLGEFSPKHPCHFIAVREICIPYDNRDEDLTRALARAYVEVTE